MRLLEKIEKWGWMLGCTETTVALLVGVGAFEDL
jgi:hypothetical protein